MIDTTSSPSFNRKALLSFLAAVLALLALCAGFLPVPFTALICFPPGAILGILSLVFGGLGLRELRTDGKRGRRLALLAILGGGLMLLTLICLVAVGIALWPRISEALGQVWQQLRP